QASVHGGISGLRKIYLATFASFIALKNSFSPGKHGFKNGFSQLRNEYPKAKQQSPAIAWNNNRLEARDPLEAELQDGRPPRRHPGRASVTSLILRPKKGILITRG
ncbi:MAG: hypothetical protein IMZ57_06840, partial [Acidobacteria bacterium]|nr:hypothetical protein [Acidobacteriota bacterium]